MATIVAILKFLLYMYISTTVAATIHQLGEVEGKFPQYGCVPTLHCCQNKYHTALVKLLYIHCMSALV